MKKFIAMMMATGLIDKPHLRHYWSTNSVMHTPYFPKFSTSGAMDLSQVNDLEELIFKIAEDSAKCYNGTIIHLIRTHSEAVKVKGRRKTIQFTKIAELLLQSFSNCDTQNRASLLIPQIRSVHGRFFTLSKNKSRHWQEILTFLNTEFIFHPLLSTLECSPPNRVLCTSSPPHPTSSCDTDKVLTPAKTRRDCVNCSSAKKTNISLAKKVQSHRVSVHKLIRSAATVKKQLNVRLKNQKLKRYKEKIDELKQVIKRNEVKLNYRTKKNIAASLAVDDLKRENLKLKVENDKLKEHVQQLTSSIAIKNRDLVNEQKYAEYITTTLEDQENDQAIICSKSGKGYSEAVRCVYYQLICDVPIQSCGLLILKIVEILLGKGLDKVPSPATCSQMAYELSVLSSLHLIEFMQGQKSLCLSWDATTIEGAHVNEIHLTANRVECLILDMRHLPGGKSSDYVTHIISALSDAAAVYSNFHGLQTTEILSALKASISCTLTDRAAVNGAVTRQLCNELDSELLFLNCNVHPLDSVARDVKKDLVRFDAQHGIQGRCYGSEGTAANLIKAISVLRYKDGKGDPVGFKNFLRQHNVPVGSFPRYVGNRLHILFHLAGQVILHEDKLREFIEKQSTAGERLRSSILKDINNKKIMAQVWALAVVGKTVTGPWMTKFYSSTMSNLEMGNLIQSSITRLQIWAEDVGVLLPPQCNIFGDRLDPDLDDVVSFICSYVTEEGEIQRGAAESAMLSTLAVLSRQLADFVDGQFSKPSRDILDKAASAPTHNIASERALGSLDRLWRRAPNATMGFLNGKVLAKTNKTLQWLDSKECEQRTALINFAMRQAQTERNKKIFEEVATKKEISERRLEVESKREMSKRRSVIRELNKVFSHKKDIVNVSFQCHEVALQHVQSFISSPESVVGSLVFYSDQQLYARIQNVKKNNKLLVSFWNLAEIVDCKVAASSFYADVVLSKILFM